jgi:hypothetical protein
MAVSSAKMMLFLIGTNTSRIGASNIELFQDGIQSGSVESICSRVVVLQP